MQFAGTLRMSVPEKPWYGPRMPFVFTAEETAPPTDVNAG